MNWSYQYITIFKIVSNNYRQLTISFVGVSIIFLLCSALNSLLPVLLRNTANSIQEANNLQTQFLFFAASYSAIWTLSQVLSNIRGIFSAWMLAKCDTTIYEAIINKVFRYPYKKQQNLDPGYVVSDISRSARSFSMVTVGVFWTITPIAVEIIIAISVLYSIMGLTYALLFLLASLVLICISTYVAKSSSNIHRELFEADDNLSSYTVERLGRTYDIKLNNTQHKECHAGKVFFRRLRQDNQKSQSSYGHTSRHPRVGNRSRAGFFCYSVRHPLWLKTDNRRLRHDHWLHHNVYDAVTFNGRDPYKPPGQYRFSE
ncbi:MULTISPECIES: ABC transporter transmembrane domain-containing protein [unclassified Pseudomonas]|uniref:ABC transporter transmembrane domain-containing protein n=1 Tax=unclassified Pseudomonas TaxID=196821 RepID=UPI000A1E5D2D|nr:ABC transporter ATP-binding protein [Pseudomonas sp. BG5]